MTRITTHDTLSSNYSVVIIWYWNTNFIKLLNCKLFKHIVVRHSFNVLVIVVFVPITNLFRCTNATELFPKVIAIHISRMFLKELWIDPTLIFNVIHFDAIKVSFDKFTWELAFVIEHSSPNNNWFMSNFFQMIDHINDLINIIVMWQITKQTREDVFRLNIATRILQTTNHFRITEFVSEIIQIHAFPFNIWKY
ncbi:hypothetical protein DQT32_04170 [Salmonella enterica subsp. enterica serovar Braenderup]|nr:hypothetical protein [Salmonella enterica subsp. enterica serovar Braenderup]